MRPERVGALPKSATANIFIDRPWRAVAIGRTTLDQMLEYEGYAQTVAYLTPEYEEGVAAFREKRAPDFAGAAARAASCG